MYVFWKTCIFLTGNALIFWPYEFLEAAEIIRTVTLALAHLHSMNFAHRDLKVSKIVVLHKYHRQE